MILIVAAMSTEIKEIINHLIPGVEVIVTGVGKVNAAMKLTEKISSSEITQIYNLGLSGATDHYQVGDVIMIEGATYHDFDLSMFGYEKGQVPHYPAIIPSDYSLIEQSTKYVSYAKKGTLYTGDRFMTSITDQPMIFDMEGAAYYQVAHHYQIPIISYKVISDIVGMDKHLESYQAFEEEKGAKLLLKVYQDLIKGMKL